MLGLGIFTQWSFVLEFLSLSFTGTLSRSLLSVFRLLTCWVLLSRVHEGCEGWSHCGHGLGRPFESDVS